MNDEDFARRAFAAAFRSGHTGEPPTLPDVELLALHGRRANRYRHGAYAAGTTALAGVVVAGVVTGPALLGLGSPSTSGISVGAGAPASQAPSSSSSPPDPAKPSPPGVPCATAPAIDWLSVVNGALPAGVTATPDHAANCVQMPDGSRSIEALFKLSTGRVQLQVNAQTGPEIAAKLGATAGKIGSAPASDSPPESLDPATLAQLEASKMAHAGSAAGMNSASAVGSPQPSLDAAALSSLEAQKRAMASAAATASPAPGMAKGVDNGTCSQVGPDENACVSHVSKDSLSVVDVQLLRTGRNPAVIDVAASNGKDTSIPASGELPSDATMLALAQAVAAHF
jgi:hypothetical protein